MNRAFLYLTFSILFLTTACEKKKSTTTGNPLIALNMTSSQNALAVAVTSFEKWIEKFFLLSATAAVPPTIADKALNVVSLDEGWLVVKEIEFEATEIPEVDEVDGDQVKLTGPYVVNLFSANADSLGATTLEMSTIRRIKMKLHRMEILTDGAPAALVSKSIYFHGTLGSKEFSLASEEGTEFEIGGPTGLVVKDNMNVLLTIRIIPLIAQIDMSWMLTQTSPIAISDSNKGEAGSNNFICPDIDPSSTNIYDCFRKGIELQADLGEDSDASGEIEDDEVGVRDI
jgi:hypothetical protein